MTVLIAPFTVTEASDQLVKQHKENLKFISNFKNTDDDSAWDFFSHKSVLMGRDHNVTSEFHYAINQQTKQMRRWTMQEEREMVNYNRKSGRSKGSPIAQKAKEMVNNSIDKISRAAKNTVSNQMSLL